MITTFLLTILYAFLSFIINLLPTGSLPEGVASAITYFWAIANAFSYVLPVVTILQALLVVFVFELVLLVWAFINWVIRKIPGMQ